VRVALPGQLGYGGTYDSVDIEQDPNGVVYTFNNVILGGQANDSSIICLNGTNVVFSGVPHYFHFLKEYLSVYLHTRRTIDKNAKYIWIDHDGYHFPKYQDMKSVHNLVFQMMSGFEGIRLKDTDFYNTTLLIEKLVVMWDSQMVIVNEQFPRNDYGNTPTLNLELREFFSQYAIEDSSLPKKIFLTRKIVSEDLPKHPDYDSTGQKWKKEQIRLRSNPAWVEDAIEDHFVSQGYKIVQLSGMPLPDQVRLFHNVERVAGLLGTAFYNGIFSKPGTQFTAIRTTPDYWYNFEGDIKGVIDTPFTYINLYNKVSYTQVKMMLKSAVYSRKIAI
jgi:hypothetical protein